ncbi:DMT family transporter [Actinoplanes sp. NPDC049681]|uniref:DMT family transporter n=1 Tax=Actinoplanes sp. NPDC049681 TaxID=3363905 RepID=UPI0037BC2045
MRSRHLTLLALVTAGLLWGTTVPLTKVALTGVGPAWLTVLRFALAVVPLAYPARHQLRQAVSARTLVWGALGYGVVIVLQNTGIARTSVSHSALILGATPLLTAVLGVATGRSRIAAPAWVGLAISGLGIGVIASHGGGEATLTGDALVGASALLSAAFLHVQPSLLAGRTVTAVTAVQFAAGAAAALPFAALSEPPSGHLPGTVALLATAALAVGGTLLPFTLFAYGQTRIAPETAASFVNLEPIVGTALGVAAFGDTVTTIQVGGAFAAITGIALTSASLVRGNRHPQPHAEIPAPEQPRIPVPAGGSEPGVSVLDPVDRQVRQQTGTVVRIQIGEGGARLLTGVGGLGRQ